MWRDYCFFIVPCGFPSSLQVNSAAGLWIGYQILTGVGSGSAYQAPFVAIQGAVEMKDGLVGNAVTWTFNSLGAAVGLSIAQIILINISRAKLKTTPPIDVDAIVKAGASNVRKIAPSQCLLDVLRAYNSGVTTIFFVGGGCARVALLSVVPLGMKSVKPKKATIKNKVP